MRAHPTCVRAALNDVAPAANCVTHTLPAMHNSDFVIRPNGYRNQTQHTNISRRVHTNTQMLQHAGNTPCHITATKFYHTYKPQPAHLLQQAVASGDCLMTSQCKQQRPCALQHLTRLLCLCCLVTKHLALATALLRGCSNCHATGTSSQYATLQCKTTHALQHCRVPSVSVPDLKPLVLTRLHTISACRSDCHCSTTPLLQHLTTSASASFCCVTCYNCHFFV
jgi:hypothetical protein